MWSQTWSLTWAPTWSQTWSPTWSQTWSQTWPLTWAQTWAQTWPLTWAQTWAQTWSQTWAQTWAQTWSLTGALTIAPAKEVANGEPSHTIEVGGGNPAALYASATARSASGLFAGLVHRPMSVQRSTNSGIRATCSLVSRSILDTPNLLWRVLPLPDNPIGPRRDLDGRMFLVVQRRLVRHDQKKLSG